MNTLRLKYTANFKRDYVAGAALVIFFVIVAAETALAVALPLYMNQEAALAVSVRRLRLMETFDGTRSRATNLKLKDETARAEAMLLVWNLDLMADYLRRYSKYLSGDELTVLQQQLNVSRTALLSMRLAPVVQRSVSRKPRHIHFQVVGLVLRNAVPRCKVRIIRCFLCIRPVAQNVQGCLCRRCLRRGVYDGHFAH